MSTNNSWNNAISAAKSAITLNAGTNTISVSTDASATTVNIGTGAAAKTVTLGSTNTSSALTLNSGSGGITATGVASVSVSNKNYVTINTSTGALGSDSGPTPGSLILIQTQTTAGATSLDFTTGISSTYSTYLVLMRGILSASGTPAFQMLYSTNGGSSYLSSNYQTGYNATSYNSATWGNGNSTTVCNLASLSSSNPSNGFFYIHGLGSAVVANYAGQLWQGNGPQQNVIYGSNTTTTINAIRFNTSSGNIVGTISLYGVAQ
jgi:hypothetical protein